MRKWQELRWERRYRHEEENLLNQAMLVAVIGIIIILIVRLPISYALFSTYEQTPPVSFRAATFEENINVRPGNSKTNDSPGDPGPAFDVASMVNGQIYLDFGTYPAGNNRNFPSVLIITNISSRTLYLDWYLTGDLAAFFDTQSGLIEIGHDEEYELGFKLNTNPDDFPGDYNGTLHISTMNGFIACEIPVKLNIYENKNKDGKKIGILSDKKSDDGEDPEPETEVDGDDDAESEKSTENEDNNEQRPDDSVVSDDEDNNQNPEGDIDEQDNHTSDDPDNKNADDISSDEDQELEVDQESQDSQEPDEAQESQDDKDSDASSDGDKEQTEQESVNPDSDSGESAGNPGNSDTDNSDEKDDEGGE